jgi:hypothetical protein
LFFGADWLKLMIVREKKRPIRGSNPGRHRHFRKAKDKMHYQSIVP